MNDRKKKEESKYRSVTSSNIIGISHYPCNKKSLDNKGSIWRIFFHKQRRYAENIASRNSDKPSWHKICLIFSYISWIFSSLFEIGLVVSIFFFPKNNSKKFDNRMKACNEMCFYLRIWRNVFENIPRYKSSIDKQIYSLHHKYYYIDGRKNESKKAFCSWKKKWEYNNTGKKWSYNPSLLHKRIFVLFWDINPYPWKKACKNSWFIFLFFDTIYSRYSTNIVYSFRHFENNFLPLIAVKCLICSSE